MKILMHLLYAFLCLIAVSNVDANNDGIDCPFCNKRECFSAMAQLDCGPAGYARDVCGCCFRCAASENEMCGGFRNLFGQCGFDMYCKPQPIPYQSDQPIPRYGYCTKLEGVRNFQNDLIESKQLMLDVITEELQQQIKNSPMDYPDIGFQADPNSFQMDDSNYWAATDRGVFGEGLEQGATFTTENQLWGQCAPPCSRQLCLDYPRAICSAKNILSPTHKCDDNPCEHTSCLACGYEPDTSVCGYCEEETKTLKYDKCMIRFGKCVKTMRRVTKKNPDMYLKQGVISYECAVPKCGTSNYLKMK
ncbi:uncharacterized protein LOC134843859 [Symsagittifera roscoffensis]|uniref:uncharacterized protein LOC134843859 n=1 Tax=Symsagittifera roscoffensis TaxID=84072 RepID=UPI00307B981D